MHVAIDEVKWNYFVLNYQEYSSGMPLAVFYFVMILILYVSQKRKAEKAIFVYPFLLQMLTIFNPLFMYFIISKMEWSDRYYRFFWCIPIGIVIAYFCVLLVNESKGVSHRKVLGLLMALTIIVAFDHFIKLDIVSSNIYKMQPEVIEIVEMIREEEGEKDVCVFYPAALIPHIRQYDAGILSPAGRNDIISESVMDEMIEKYVNWGMMLRAMANAPIEVEKEEFLNILYEYNVQYYVVKKDWYSQKYRDALNLKLLGETENYYIYQV